MTCATFVLLVFELAAIQLLDETSWLEGRDASRKAEDLLAQRRIVAFLERTDPRHAAHIAGELGAVRVRAEEVAAASGLAPHPVMYAAAAPEGERLLREVRGA